MRSGSVDECSRVICLDPVSHANINSESFPDFNHICHCFVRDLALSLSLFVYVHVYIVAQPPVILILIVNSLLLGKCAWREDRIQKGWGGK